VDAEATDFVPSALSHLLSHRGKEEGLLARVAARTTSEPKKVKRSNVGAEQRNTAVTALQFGMKCPTSGIP
jgi:hypothetical protein